ncbi:hypothetical protein [Methylicorpusculum sp.]|nr:hypothetical protein [Methylicorpusculum sp.]
MKPACTQINSRWIYFGYVRVISWNDINAIIPAWIAGIQVTNM